MTDLLKSHHLFSIQAETGVNDRAFALIKNLEHIVEFIKVVLVRQIIERTDGILISNHLRIGSHRILGHRCIEGCRALGSLLQQGELTLGDSQNIRKHFVGGFLTKLLGQHGRNPTNAGQLVDKMNRETDRFSLICQSSFDGLFDPPPCIGAKLPPFFGVKLFNRLH